MTMTNDTIIQFAERRCQAHGGRLTMKRKQVLMALIRSDRALSAYELIEFCKGYYGESIAAMTAYRILDFLQDNHLVHKLRLANKYIACTHVCFNQDHNVCQFLICVKCSKVKEIEIDPALVANLQASAQRSGFTPITRDLEVNCLCSDCEFDTA